MNVLFPVANHWGRALCCVGVFRRARDGAHHAARPPRARGGDLDLRAGRAGVVLGVLPMSSEDIVKLAKSSSIDPQDTRLQPVVNPPCWASKRAVSFHLTIPLRIVDVLPGEPFRGLPRVGGHVGVHEGVDRFEIRRRHASKPIRGHVRSPAERAGPPVPGHAGQCRALGAARRQVSKDRREAVVEVVDGCRRVVVR